MLPFCLTNPPSRALIGAPFSVPIPRTKTVIPSRFARAISSVKSSWSPPSVKRSRYFRSFSFIICAEASSSAVKSVPFSVMKEGCSCLTRKRTALWSKLSGATR